MQSFYVLNLAPYYIICNSYPATIYHLLSGKELNKW